MPIRSRSALLFLCVLVGAPACVYEASPGGGVGPASLRGRDDSEQERTLVAQDQWAPGPAPTTRAPAMHVHAFDGDPLGPPLWVSNNPEVVTGEGWTMQTARTDAQRGGEAHPLSGPFVAYAFHINGSGRTLYFHLLVTNPGEAPLSVEALGAAYTNQTRPLGGPASGQSYAVARAFTDGDFNISSSTASLQRYRAAEVMRITVPAGAMMDARLELQTNGPAYVYGVFTTSGDLTSAVNASQRGPAPGVVVSPSANEFGRMAGVYDGSELRSSASLEVPAAPAFTALAFNTHAKFALDGVYLPDQTVPALQRLDDSSEKSYGNYGLLYDLDVELVNPATEPRGVRMFFASHVTGPVDQPSFSYNGPVLVDGRRVDVYTRPTAPRQELATFALAPGERRVVRVLAYIPGLISAGSQLLFEALPIDDPCPAPPVGAELDLDATDVFCPAGFALDRAYDLCVSSEEASGPFPGEMVTRCQQLCGDDECDDARWPAELARAIRGVDDCPPGTDRDGPSGLCTDGEHAYGPFAPGRVERCIALGGGRGACESNRWGLAFARWVTSFE